MLTTRHHITALLLILTIGTSCESQTAPPGKENQNEFQVLGVNTYKFLIKDNTPGGVIVFSSAKLNRCSLSFVKNKFNLGYHYKAEAFGEMDIDLTCQNSETQFSMSPIAPTFIDMKVSELNNKKAVVELSFSLYSIRTKEELKREHALLTIEGKHLADLSSQNDS